MFRASTVGCTEVGVERVRSPLSLAVAGLSPRDIGVGGGDRVDAESLRGVLGWMGGVGLSAVQLDATSPGLRPREMDRSARRDLASILRRFELSLSGVDLWIPPGHFVDAAHAERAAAAVDEALRFAVEVSGLAGGDGVVCVTLPGGDGGGKGASGAGGNGWDGEVRSLFEELSASASRVGGVLADCSPGSVFGVGVESDAVGVGVDPASVLAGGGDPGGVVVGAGERVMAARLSDADHAGRAVVGRGHLDVAGYAGALAAVGYRRRVVVDVRGLRSGVAGVEAALACWPMVGG